MMTVEELNVLRSLRDSICADIKALRTLERREKLTAESKAGGFLRSFYRSSLPDDYRERMADLRDGVYRKQRRYLTAQALLEKELSCIPNQYARVLMSLYFVDLTTKQDAAELIGKKSGQSVGWCVESYLANRFEAAAEMSPEKALTRELNEFRFVAFQIERLTGKLERKSPFPDFFLPFAEDTEVPATTVWKEELTPLVNLNLRLIAYIESIPDPWERRVFQTRFIDGKTARETARELGETTQNIFNVVRSCLRRHPEGYVSCRELADSWGAHVNTIREYCAQGKFPGAMKRRGCGGANPGFVNWIIPADFQNLRPLPKPGHYPNGYASCSEFSKAWGLCPASIEKYCRDGRIPGAVRNYGYGNERAYVWMIPADAQKPRPQYPEGYLSCRELAELWGMSNLTIQKYCQQGKFPGAIHKSSRLWLIPADVRKPEPEPYPDGYLSCRDVAELWGIGVGTVRVYCQEGKLPGAVKKDGSEDESKRSWLIPADVRKPKPKRWPEGYLPCDEAAEKLGMRKRTLVRYCKQGKVPGAIKGKSGNWLIPANAHKPKPEQCPESYLSCRELAERWGMSFKTIEDYCKQGKLPGAVRERVSVIGRKWRWMIPADAPKPKRALRTERRRPE